MSQLQEIPQDAQHSTANDQQSSFSVTEVVKEIKQSFRLLMDGAIAQSMRDKGVDYHLNWGVTLPRLHEQAEELRNKIIHQTNHTVLDGNRDAASASAADGILYELSIALWKENVRECKILATMLMPASLMLSEVCDIWMEQMPTQEIAEQAAFRLWQYLPYAPKKAFQWIADERELYQLCGFHVLTRLFMRGHELNERGINEFLDQALSAIQGPFVAVRKAAFQSVQRFAELGIVYERMAKSALKGSVIGY
jgi:hypothetical protein